MGSQPEIRQLDKDRAETISSYDVSEMITGTVSHWAFAFWGARLHVFIREEGQPHSSLWRMNLDGDTREEYIPDTGYSIVGAGVSVCAPTLLY